MIGKPYPLTRVCFACSNRHAVGQSCDDARRERWAAFTLDLVMMLGGALFLGGVAYMLWEVLP